MKKGCNLPLGFPLTSGPNNLSNSRNGKNYRKNLLKFNKSRLNGPLLYKYNMAAPWN